MIATLRPLTYDDLKDMPDDGQRYEIIGGELLVTPSPTAGHQRVLFRLAKLLDGYVLRHGTGEVFVAPFDVLLGTFDAVEPDIVYLAAARPRVANDENSIDYAPDLVVEVASPSSHRIDRVKKMALYARSGVAEYWIADPMRRRIDVYALAGENFLPVEPNADGHIPSRVLPGLRIDPEAIFAGFE
jgi:Uma2 family endonuclease